MKFLCDNCKAKYQIADEKVVAGKTVRMKCRKCGHQIEVRADVAEKSGSFYPPQGVPGGSEAPRARSNLATSLSAAKPRSPAASHPPGGALAGAFQRTVQDGSDGMIPSSMQGGAGLSVTDEWYVAINGVPVGPVRISELRRKAATGAVNEESLCWQEGLEEWRPVRSIPELAAIVREAALGARPSLTAPPPSDGRPSSPPRPGMRPSAPSRSALDATRSEGPARPGAPQGVRSNVVPLRVAVAATGAMSSQDEGLHSVALGGGGAAALATSPFGSPAPTFTPAPAIAHDPFAVPPAPAAAPALAARVSSSPFIPPVAPLTPAPAYEGAANPKRGTPLWFWPILAFTVVFAISAAAFVFFQKPAQPTIVIQAPPAAATTAGASEAKTDPQGQVASAEPTPTATSTVATTKVAATPKGTGAAAAPVASEKKGFDVSGLLGGAGGPNLGGAGPGAGAGGGLDSSSVERVVASHRAGVKRTCWERGGADQKSSVNVTISATVAPDGSVANTSSIGDDPVVAKCIEGQVKNWRFNAPGSSTTVNIPFKFVRQ